MRSSLLAHTAVVLVTLQLMMHSICVLAVDLDQCGARLQGQQNTTQNTTDAQGSPPTLRVSYEQCLVECGGGLGDINWQYFSSNFGAWSLPWISLMFQIPFGGEQPLDDLMSFFVTIGSPALAAYSLQITHLNRCWIAGAFLDVEYPNSKLIPTVLAAFHHIPIKMEYNPPFLHSLIVLPKNDQFWSHLAAANKTRRWSIPLVMSYILAIFSLFLTIADAATTNPGSSRYGIAAIWTFLLPLIIGWLPEPSHLRKSLASANRAAWIANNQRDCPVKMTMSEAIEFAGTDDVDLARKDELRPVPVFNYSRAFTTPANAEVLLRLMKNASVNAKQIIPVRGSASEGTLAWVGGEGDEIPSEVRLGTAAEVVRYCTMVFQPPKEDLGFAAPLETQSLESTKITNQLLDDGLVTPSRWAPGVWKRVAISSFLALGLQWATAGAAVFIQYVPIPVGLGCRASSFLMYGVMGTLSFFLFLASSILAQMSRPLHGQVPTRSWSRAYQNAGAIICRWLG